MPSLNQLAQDVLGWITDIGGGHAGGGPFQATNAQTGKPVGGTGLTSQIPGTKEGQNLFPNLGIGDGSDPSTTAAANKALLSLYKPPDDAAGNAPDSYSLWQQGPDYSEYIKANPDAPKSMSVEEYTKLAEQARGGNEEAKEIIRSYRPDYPQTVEQDERQITAPYANAIEGESKELAPLEQEAEGATPSASSADANAASIAQQISGTAPPPPSALTNSEDAANAAAVAPYMKQINDIESSNLSSMASAAKQFQQSYPYQSMMNDLLGRYAYTFESPYITPTLNQPGSFPAWMQQLFTVASAVNASGATPTTAGTLPGATGTGAGTNTSAAQLSNEAAAQEALQTLMAQQAQDNSNTNLQPAGGVSSAAAG